MGIFDILGGAVKLGVAGLGPGNALNAAQLQGQANEASQEALEAARQDMAARQPFRDQLFASLQGGQAQRPDLSNLFGSENPFASALGPLNPQQQQAAAPIMPGPTGAPPGIDSLTGSPRITGNARLGTGGGGSGRFRSFREDEERFGGRFGRDN